MRQGRRLAIPEYWIAARLDRDGSPTRGQAEIKSERVLRMHGQP